MTGKKILEILSCLILVGIPGSWFVNYFDIPFPVYIFPVLYIGAKWSEWLPKLVNGLANLLSRIHK